MKKITLFWFFLFGITQFGFAQDSLVAKILNDFNNRPAGISNEIAQKLMLNPGLTEEVLSNFDIEIRGFIPWSAYRVNIYEEVWYKNGWHTLLLSPHTEKDKALSSFIMIMIPCFFLLTLMMSQLDGIISYKSVKNNRIYGNPTDEFVKLSRKRMLFDQNLLIFLLRDIGFWMALLMSVMCVFTFSACYNSNKIQLIGMSIGFVFIVFCGGIMNAWWYQKSLEKLSSQILKPLPPSDDD